MKGLPQGDRDRLARLSKASVDAVSAENVEIERLCKARIKELWPTATKARLDYQEDDNMVWWYLTSVKDANDQELPSDHIDEEDFVWELVQELWPVLDWCGVSWIEWVIE